MPYLPAGGSNRTAEEGGGGRPHKTDVLQQISGKKKTVPVLKSGQRGFWRGCSINYLSEKAEYTEGSPSGELVVTDGGEEENERLARTFQGRRCLGPSS